MYRYFISLILFFNPVLQSGAGVFEMNTVCRDAYRNVYLLNFKETARLLSAEKKTNPENKAVYFIEHYSDFLKAFISEDEQDFENVKDLIDKRLKEIDKIDDRQPWKDLARGEMLMQLAILKLKNKEFLTAGYYIRKSYRIIDANRDKFPGFKPNLKSLGFFHAVIGAVPENYKWLANLAGMSGTIKQGSAELTDILNACKADPDLDFMYNEVLFLKIFIRSHLEKDPASCLTMIEMENKFNLNQSALSAFLYANTLYKNEDYSKAIDVLDQYKFQDNTYPLLYLDYLKGSLKLNRLLPGADSDLKKYTDNYKGKSFIKSAWLKRAWIQLLNKNTVTYNLYLENVRNSGNEFTDEDKYAMKEAESNVKPNLHLLRSRLLFDGGLYNEAMNELAGKPSTDFPTTKDQIEFTYRLARIFDKKGQSDKAVKYYTKTYENGRNYEWYFAANSALLIAEFYESGNNYTSSQEWYKKCLDLRHHEYQNSIDQKAEAGLNRLKTKSKK